MRKAPANVIAVKGSERKIQEVTNVTKGPI